tara:strand:- start:116 stop:619 length:504 start_codon:yes stop_codon:yes gene_type:complete
LKKSFNKDTNIYSKTMSFSDNSLLPVVYGDHDRFLKIIEKKMDVSIVTRGNFLKISGAENMVQITGDLLETLFKNAQKNNFLDEGEVHGMINLYRESRSGASKKIENIDSLSFTAGKKLIKPRSKRQVDYFNLVKKKKFSFLLWSSRYWKNIFGCCSSCLYAQNRTN